MKIQLTQSFGDIASLENLLAAWEEFIKGKRKKQDVQQFQLRFMDNLCDLHESLNTKSYQHHGYTAFNICDPKPRNIHKATVRDRLLHHAMYRVLYPFFDRTFIADSYSCRMNKGTHKALGHFNDLMLRVSRNTTKTCWVLKCDIKKFFASIDHKILLSMLQEYIPDKKILWLLKNVIDSFETKAGVGLPLGNLTSQLFVNIYMNEFDQFVKHQLKAKYYIRYADDFVILSQDRTWLKQQIPVIASFLWERLRLELHPDKLYLQTAASGVDFLGWVHFPTHRVLRTTTRRRMMRNLARHSSDETLQSYLGLLRHGNTHTLQTHLLNPLVGKE